MYYPATLSPYGDGSGRYGVTFEDLPGCVSVGENIEDALRMAQEALGLHLEGMLKDGDPIPAPSTLDEARKKNEDMALEESYDIPEGTFYQFIFVEAPKEQARPEPVKFSVSLQPVVLGKLEDIRRELGVTRSGAIAAAALHYHRYIKNLEG